MYAGEDMEEAQKLYLQGVEAERNGSVYEAIFYYRRAVQLVPDIEFRVAEYLPAFKKENDDEQDSSYDDALNDNVYEDGVEDESSEDEDEFEDLATRFLRYYGKTGKLCHTVFDQQARHVSTLPKEVLVYIFKWIISSDLDMRSLEQMALVCRGFYLLSRESELWRLACTRVWGDNCGSPNMYGSWREMYINRPRLRFNGAYISKTTYVRPGETAFQDHTYRPWHIVDYYRYLRFFPEGIILMMTTPEEPITSISNLRQRSIKHQAVLSGHYHMHGNRVSAVLRRTSVPSTQDFTPRYRRCRPVQQTDYGEQTFHVEFEVLPYKKIANYKLEWRGYSITTIFRNGETSIASEFDLSHTSFPPFWFSRVKSYTATSEKPLQ